MPELCLVGYTYRNYPLEHALKSSRSFGYHGIELRDFCDIDLSTPAAVDKSLKDASARARQSDISIYSLFYKALSVSREKERLPEEQAFLQVIPILANYQVSILHTRLSLYQPGETREVVSASACEADYAAVQQTLLRILPVCERHQVRIALEAHMGTLHDTAASLLRIVNEAASPWLVAGLDFANLRIANPAEDLVKVIQDFGARIGYTHIKNVKIYTWGYDWNIPVRWGDINYFQVLQALKNTGYRGPLAVEYCGSGDPDVFAEDDARYLKRLLERLGW